MIKFLAYFSLCTVGIWLGLYLKQSAYFAMVDSLLSIFLALIMLAGPASYALYAYVDSISKDISANIAITKRPNYLKTIITLTALKQEILSNIFTLIALLLLEVLVKVVGQLTIASSSDSHLWLLTLISSLRLSCFFMAILIIISQLRGFNTANKFREIIS